MHDVEARRRKMVQRSQAESGLSVRIIKPADAFNMSFQICPRLLHDMPELPGELLNISSDGHLLTGKI